MHADPFFLKTFAMRHQLIFAGLLVISFFSCKKDEKAPDYRQPYIGTYSCLKTVYESPSNTTDSTMVSIDVAMVGDSMIRLLGEEVRVSASGQIGVDATGSCNFYNLPAYRLFCGNFNPDSMYLQTWVGGLGTFTQTHYFGKKQ